MSGSKYSRSAASQSVDTVSGLQLIITASRPCARSPAIACTQQASNSIPCPIRTGPEPRMTTDGRSRRRHLVERPEAAVEVRRRGGELAGAGVDLAVAAHAPRRRPPLAHRRSRACRRAGRGRASPKPSRLAAASSVAVAEPALGDHLLRRPRAPRCGARTTGPSATPARRARAPSRAAAPRRPPTAAPGWATRSRSRERLVVERRELPRGARARPGPAPASAPPSAAPPRSWRRSPSPRPPTSSRCRGCRSAPGNFSKAKRGILTTT